MAAGEALYQEGRSYEAAGNDKKAISRYKEVYKKYRYADSAPEAKFHEAELLYKQGKLVNSFDAYQELIENFQGSRHYQTAFDRQIKIAHQAADGIIKNNFLGLKSKIGPERVEKMMSKVRDNAPKAPSASAAQFAIGASWQESKIPDKAIGAYRQVSLNYPESKEAPEALYRVGELLMMKSEKGNQNLANLDSARNVFEDVILQYPNHKRANDSRANIKMIRSQDITRSFEIGKFYESKKEYQSAKFYYNDVLKKAKKGSDLEKETRQRLANLGQ